VPIPVFRYILQKILNFFLNIKSIKTQYNNTMKIVKTGEEFIHMLSNGEAMLYQASDDPINPVKLVKTLSPEEIKDIK